MPIERALRMMGVGWVRTIRTYSVATMVKTLREAMLTTTKGLKVIIADGECQLARQRRIKPATRQALQAGERARRPRHGVCHAVCTRDHSCLPPPARPPLPLQPQPPP